MADSTISALPSATLPVAGADLFAIVQSGATKKVQRSDFIRDLDISFIKDDFQIGNNTGGSIGELRWLIPNGTTAAQVSEASHPGITRLSTSATGGISFKDTTLSAGRDQLLFSEFFDMTLVFRINGTLANLSARIGLVLTSLSATANPPTDGIFFERLSGDSNWFGVVRASSSQTRTDTTVAATGNFIRLRMRRIDATTIGFTVANAAEVTNTATQPSGGAFVNISIVAISGTQTSDVDYFDLLVTGLTR